MGKTRPPLQEVEVPDLHPLREDEKVKMESNEVSDVVGTLTPPTNEE